MLKVRHLQNRNGQISGELPFMLQIEQRSKALPAHAGTMRKSSLISVAINW